MNSKIVVVLGLMTLSACSPAANPASPANIEALPAVEEKSAVAEVVSNSATSLSGDTSM